MALDEILTFRYGPPYTQTMDLASATQQRTAIQSLISCLPARVKSNALADYLLKCTSAVLSAAGAIRLLYADEKTIVSKILSALGKGADEAEIRANQEECRSLFTPDQRLMYGPAQLILYPLIRILRPEIIVETGCAWGGSAAFLLAALHKNAHGCLVSIDLPASETVQAKVPWMDVRKSEIGALIPPTLRSRWNLIVGDARSCLPRLLTETNADIFIHDSLHTTTHQAFEYETARSLMRNNTVIASDDIRWNDSFPNFLKLHNLCGYAPLRGRNFGITANQFDPYEIKCGLFR